MTRVQMGGATGIEPAQNRNLEVLALPVSYAPAIRPTAYMALYTEDDRCKPCVPVVIYRHAHR